MLLLSLLLLLLYYYYYLFFKKTSSIINIIFAIIILFSVLFFFKTYLSFYPCSFYLTSFAWFLLSLFFSYVTSPTLPSIYGSHRSFLNLSLSSLSLTSSLIFFYSTSPTFFPQTVASMGAPLSSLSPLFSHHGGHGSHDHGALSLSSFLSPLFYLYLSLTSLSFPKGFIRVLRFRQNRS